MIVSLAGQKGGSGKTTTAICIADELHCRDRKTLLVDTDPQATARTWADVAAERETDGPAVIGMGPGFHEELETIADGYDDIVIDCPPGHSEIQRAAMMVSDVTIIPSGPGLTDLWSLAETIDLAKKATTVRPALTAAIMLTRRDARTNISERAQEVLEEAELPVFDTSLGSRVAYQECPSEGVGVTRYRPSGTAADEVRALVDEIEATANVEQLQEVG